MDPYFSYVTIGCGSNHGKYEIWGTGTVQMLQGFQSIQMLHYIAYIHQIMR
jgi:hypothetical protein